MRTCCKKLVAVVGIAAMLEACAYRSGTTYSPAETGAVMRVESAEIVSSREILIAGLDDKQAAGWGTIVGATIAGAAAYGITEADNPAGVAITIIAAVVGGLAGLAAEERRKTRRGAEYILRDEAGKRVAVVQSLGPGEEIYPSGTSVSLIHGSRGYVRVVPDQPGAPADVEQGAPEPGGTTSRGESGQPRRAKPHGQRSCGRTIPERTASVERASDDRAVRQRPDQTPPPHRPDLTTGAISLKGRLPRAAGL